MTRLAARIWVQAYVKRLELQGIPAFIVRHGDNTAGAIIVKLNTLDGQAVAFNRGFDLMSGDAKWVELSAGAQDEVDDAISRQASFDPDLWVVEVEDRHGRHLLDEPGLA